MEYPNELSIRITGQAGQGIETIGLALARLFKDSGFYIFANRDYMSRIRGGNNYVQLRISDRPVNSPRMSPNIIFCLDGHSVSIHLQNLAQGGVIIADIKKFNLTDVDNRFFDLPMYDLATKIGGSELFVNTVGLGVLAAITGRPFPQVETVLKDTFKGKKPEIIARNSAVALASYDMTMDNRDRFSRIRFDVHPEVPAEKQLFMSGHDGVTLGAVKGGCKFYSGYPMTPSSSILELMAHVAERYGIVVEQAEDEIAAINMVIGASFAGARAMTATSGGGFCLMTEGLALAGMTETPVVICLGMRPGPATGFPTRTSQDTLSFALNAGHGEFARVVYAPGSIEQGFHLAVKALNIAEKYQVPVIILTDQHFADSYMNIPMFDTDKVRVERYLLPPGDARNYRRYQLTPNGISPRAVPSRIEGVVYADSDEHNEAGHITENEGMGEAMVTKRYYQKMEDLSKEIEQPAALNTDEAGVILVGFGSTYGVMKDASLAMPSELGFIHIPQLWPFPGEALTALVGEEKTVLTIENNAAGQLARLILQETAIEVDGSILKFDGRPFNLDEVLTQVKEVIGGQKAGTFPKGTPLGAESH